MLSNSGHPGFLSVDHSSVTSTTMMCTNIISMAWSNGMTSAQGPTKLWHIISDIYTVMDGHSLCSYTLMFEISLIPMPHSSRAGSTVFQKLWRCISTVQSSHKQLWQSMTPLTKNKYGSFPPVYINQYLTTTTKWSCHLMPHEPWTHISLHFNQTCTGI